MSVNSVKYPRRTAPMLIFVTLFAGISGMVYQYFLDGTLLTFMVTTAAIGGLAGASKSFDERDRQLLWQSYAKAFEVLFLVIFYVYSLMLLGGWLHIGSGVIEFINGHWLSLLASTLCILLGSAGMHYFREER